MLPSRLHRIRSRPGSEGDGVEYNGQEFAKAAGNGDMAAVKLFLDAGMDVNEGAGAALGLAAGRGRLDMVNSFCRRALPTSNALQYARTRGPRTSRRCSWTPARKNEAHRRSSAPDRPSGDPARAVEPPVVPV